MGSMSRLRAIHAAHIIIGMIPERRIHEEKKSVITAGFQNENDEFTRRKQLARTKIQIMATSREDKTRRNEP